MTDSNERLLPVRELRKRYNVSTRTLDRWLDDRILPEPVRIRQNRYWRLSDLETLERRRIAAQSVKARRVTQRQNRNG
jgi:predicted DNA-binding transcriptional regulator AlpA